MAKRRKASRAGEASVPPTPSASEREMLDASVARLSGLNVDQLRLHWRNHVGGVAPAHLPGWLLMRVLAYRIQAVAFGDLDRAILRRLREPREEAFELRDARPFASRRPTTREGVGLKPGALLVREWNGRLERVMILDDGYAWNGGVYHSLSQVAKAITGTNWNGHRFFGLRAVRKSTSNRKQSATSRPNPLLDIGVSPTLAAFAPAIGRSFDASRHEGVRLGISERIGLATQQRGRAQGPSDRPAQGPAIRPQRGAATSSSRPGCPTMKRDERKIALRCAVYTRVSTDSGLEQDFNSLDNQREASEAYIESQARARKPPCRVRARRMVPGVKARALTQGRGAGTFRPAGASLKNDRRPLPRPGGSSARRGLFPSATWTPSRRSNNRGRKARRLRDCARRRLASSRGRRPIRPGIRR